MAVMVSSCRQAVRQAKLDLSSEVWKADVLTKEAFGEGTAQA